MTFFGISKNIRAEKMIFLALKNVPFETAWAVSYRIHAVPLAA